MKETNSIITNSTNQKINLYIWEPDIKVKGILQISHGMAETALRYKRFAKALTGKGYIVVANDHRGHGKTATAIDQLGSWGENGFEGCVKDLYEINQIIKNKYQKPIILFGHSMGSFMVQRYIQDFGGTIKAAILSGSNGQQSTLLLNIGIMLAKIQQSMYSSQKKSKLLNNMSFGQYNKAFKPTKTEFDWLSRNEEEVKKYIEDPYCGTIFPTQFYIDFLKGLKERSRNKNLNKIPKNLPILIISGDKDPVGENGLGVKRLYKSYKKQNITNVNLKLYKEARHELLNEINYEQVTSDIIDWINNTI